MRLVRRGGVPAASATRIPAVTMAAVVLVVLFGALGAPAPEGMVSASEMRLDSLGGAAGFVPDPWDFLEDPVALLDLPPRSFISDLNVIRANSLVRLDDLRDGSFLEEAATVAGVDTLAGVAIKIPDTTWRFGFVNELVRYSESVDYQNVAPGPVEGEEMYERDRFRFQRDGESLRALMAQRLGRFDFGLSWRRQENGQRTSEVYSQNAEWGYDQTGELVTETKETITAATPAVSWRFNDRLAAGLYASATRGTGSYYSDLYHHNAHDQSSASTMWGSMTRQAHTGVAHGSYELNPDTFLRGFIRRDAETLNLDLESGENSAFEHLEKAETAAWTLGLGGTKRFSLNLLGVIGLRQVFYRSELVITESTGTTEKGVRDSIPNGRQTVLSAGVEGTASDRLTMRAGLTWLLVDEGRSLRGGTKEEDRPLPLLQNVHLRTIAMNGLTYGLTYRLGSIYVDFSGGLEALALANEGRFVVDGKPDLNQLVKQWGLSASLSIHGEF